MDGLVIGHLFQHQKEAGKQMSCLGAQVSLEQMGDSNLFLLCQAGRLALNALCPMDGDWHTRSQTQPTGRELRGSPGGCRPGEVCAGRRVSHSDSSVSAGKKLASPRHLLVSGISKQVPGPSAPAQPYPFSPSGGEGDGEAFTGHSSWPLTGMQQPWN